jgi:hypothetical protein
MPPVDRHAEGAVSLILAGTVLLIAAVLAWREHRDRRRRDPDLVAEDARHFRLQDLRRMFGVAIMALLAVGLVYGSRLDPKAGGRTNPAFVATWLILFVLIFGLLALALIDWIALRLYAGRARRAIARERVEILRDELRQKNSTHGNGRANGSLDDLS